MEWTTEKPKEAGYYWANVKSDWASFKGDSQYNIEGIHFIELIITNSEMYIHYDVIGYDVESYFEIEDITHWMGPIEPPEAPKE